MKKKNSLKSIRTAVGMAIAVLLTTCLIGGTFARYISGATEYADARVAYWGFDDAASIEITDLFSESYTNVQSSNGSNVIAPGTEGSASFSFAFQPGEASAPEVAYRFSISATGSCSDDILDNPMIQFKLDNGSYGTWSALLSSIEALAGDASGMKTYSAGTLPAAFTTASNTHTIYWRWVFEDADDPDDQNAMDSLMGTQDELGTVHLELSVVAAQLD